MNSPKASAPITSESDICKVLTCLPEKWIVDFANTIDVVNDHNRVQRQRSGFQARLYDGMSGQGHRRQAETNSNLAKGVESSLRWISELALSQAKSNLAIERINQRFVEIREGVIDLTNFSVATREQVCELTDRFEGHAKNMRQEMQRIDMQLQAKTQLDHVMSQWGAGIFHSFSPAGRCYAVLEELRWGRFGDFLRDYPIERARFLDFAQNRLIEQLAKDAQCAPHKRLGMHQWLTAPRDRHVLQDAQEALTYVGDWVTDIDNAPFVYTVTRQPVVDSRPSAIPYLCSADTVVISLAGEVFGEE